MALAVLFTHETDYIFHIKPESWEEQLRLISRGINNYNPMMLTMDEALRIVRAHKTSQQTESDFLKRKDRINISLEGETDTKSFIYLFTGEKENISQRLVEITEFKGSIKVTLSTKSDNPLPISK